MPEFNKDMSGILSRNTSKQSDNHPDFKGDCVIAGTSYWLSGWVKERKDGSGKFFSLSFRAKDQQNGAAKPRPSISDELHDDIPF